MAPHDRIQPCDEEVPENVKQVLLTCDCICFDVDSTMLTCEGIDEMAGYAGVSEEVKALTHKAMGCKSSFRDALTERLNIIQPTERMISDILRKSPPSASLTPGFKELVEELRTRKIDVCLVSGGFQCLINQAATSCGIPSDHIVANNLFFNKKGNYEDFNKEAFTSASGGKARALRFLKEKFEYKSMIMVGDGMTDAEARPPAKIFIGFGGNVKRDAVKETSDWYITRFASITQVFQNS